MGKIKDYRDGFKDWVEKPQAHVHEWSKWKEIGRTGDWFHPLIVERKCKTCGAAQTEEH